MINNLKIRNQSTFTGIKPTIRLGEKVINDFYKEFPTLSNPSRLAQRYVDMVGAYDLDKMEQSVPGRHINSKALKCIGLRRHIPEVVFSLQRHADKLRQKMHYYNVAMCGEISELLQDSLLKQNVPVDRVTVKFSERSKWKKNLKRYSPDHSFLVLNKAKDADLTDPKSWGSKAVIVDGWLKRVGPAADVIRELKQVFKFDPKIDRVMFFDRNLASLDEYK